MWTGCTSLTGLDRVVGKPGARALLLGGRGATGECGARENTQERAEQGKLADCHRTVGNPKGWANLPASMGLLVVVGEGRANQLVH